MLPPWHEKSSGPTLSQRINTMFDRVVVSLPAGDIFYSPLVCFLLTRATQEMLASQMTHCITTAISACRSACCLGQSSFPD